MATKKAAKKSVKKVAAKVAKKAPGKTTKKATSSSKAPSRTAKKPAALAKYRAKRDFDKTAEPEGKPLKIHAGALQFVIQKHAASHLHFDLRLELDGVMKSWAVPKGPSFDPSVKRLAMQVEDHPMEYNSFEGIIPEGEYGGGTVMIWDHGVYTFWQDDPDPQQRLREAYKKGDFKFVILGKRMKGSWVLVRTKRGDPKKPQWLLIKHRDEFARDDHDVVEEEMTSATTGRTMEQIAKAKTRVWGSK